MSSVSLKQCEELYPKSPKDPSAWGAAHPSDQVPLYPDPKAVEAVVAQVKNKPPLVSYGGVYSLSRALQFPHSPFIFQGGDCAESFFEMTEERTQQKI